MRKRIIIGLLLLGIGGGLYVLFKPRDTIEYHKRMLVSAHEEGWVTRWWSRVRGDGSASDRRREKHEAALIRLGYFERREFAMTNIAGQDPVPVIGRAASSNIGSIFSVTKNPKGDKVIVTGVREDMAKWDKLIAELQSAQTNK